MIMMELVHSALLNFVQSNFHEGVDNEIIAKHAGDFFDEKSIMIAKTDLWSRVFVGERVPRRQGDLANYRHIKDIIETFQKCESDDFILPTYVIILPTEVPVIPAVAYSSLASRLLNIDSELKQIREKIVSYDLNFPPLSDPRPQPIADNQAIIVISKVPSHLNNPAKRREVIDLIPGHECIHSIKPSGDKLVVRIDQTAAKDFCDSVPSIMSNCDVKVNETKYIGIVKGLSNAFDMSMLIGCGNIKDAKRIGNSFAAKVFFENAIALANALKLGVKVGYEIFRVHEFQRPPRCCYNCQSPNHLKSSCNNPKRCSRCAEEHESSRDSPCQATPKCANCHGNHVSFSLKCRILRNAVAKRSSQLRK